MKKILLTSALFAFAFAQMNAQSPASVSTKKETVGVQAKDPVAPTAKPAVSPKAPVAAAKQAPAAVKEAKPAKPKHPSRGKKVGHKHSATPAVPASEKK